VSRPFTSTHVLATGLLQQELLDADLVPTQRLRLLRGMVEVCAAKGYAAATVADVVGAARVSRQTFYEQFEDKERCFLVAQDLGHRLILAQVARAARGDSWEEDLALVFGAYFALLADEPELAHTTLVEALGAGAQALARREAAILRHAELLERLHDFGRTQDPSLPALRRDVSLAVIGGINEMALTHLRAGHSERLATLDRTAFTFARAAMRAEVEDLARG
jgi:AcrR family transcriptional regulator